MNSIDQKKLLDNLCELIAIPSVFSEEARPGAPFGEGVAKALEKFLEIAAGLGFETKNYEGYVGEASLGQGDYVIGILGHIDVVEGGKGWDIPPFQPHIEGNKVFGRGSSDNKGPLVTALYVVKQLQDDGQIPDDVTLRIIVGTNEEEAWEDMKYYTGTAEKLPDIAIVPDGCFPVIFCEKGLYDFNLTYDFSDNQGADIKILALSGGEGRNVVPSEAVCVLEAGDSAKAALEEALRLKGVDGHIRGEDNKLTVTIKGKSSHAMSPEKGVNAISQMLDLLSVCCRQKFISAYNRVLGLTYNGEKCGCAFADEDSGKLTLNAGRILLENGKVRLDANLRYPATFPFDLVDQALKKGLEGEGFSVEFVDHLLPVRFDKDGKLIRLLMKAYREISGDTKTEPLAIGGATYARAIPNAVSFGTLFPYEEELAHEANEYMDIESIHKAAGILYYGLLLLMEEKL